MTAPAGQRASALLVLGDRPDRAGEFAAALWRHRDVLRMLARSDFHVRYKRAALGILWAVVLPLVQAVVLSVVFSRVLRGDVPGSFAAFVLSGVLPWSYFVGTLVPASTAIVDGSGLTDKLWFPRALLPAVPAFANLVGLAISMGVLVLALPIVGEAPGPELLLLVPACALLVAFTLSLSLVLSALHVYFRDVRFVVQAMVLLWFYVTPIVYPSTLLRGLRWVLELNPMTGVVTVFRLATVGGDMPWVRPVLVSVVTTIVLACVAFELHRRRDRLFVDEL